LAKAGSFYFFSELNISIEENIKTGFQYFLTSKIFYDIILQSLTKNSLPD